MPFPIKNKQWENNDIIVLSIDANPENMQADIKFDSTSFDLHYEKPLPDYFKDIKVK